MNTLTCLALLQAKQKVLNKLFADVEAKRKAVEAQKMVGGCHWRNMLLESCVPRGCALLHAAACGAEQNGRRLSRSGRRTPPTRSFTVLIDLIQTAGD